MALCGDPRGRKSAAVTLGDRGTVVFERIMGGFCACGGGLDVIVGACWVFEDRLRQKGVGSLWDDLAWLAAA